MTTNTSSGSTALPDINVLLAFQDLSHPFHAKASDWFEELHEQQWATCPLTENGFVRIACLPTFPGGPLTPRAAVAALKAIIERYATTHSFWSDDVSLRDEFVFSPSAIQGPKQITDIYLLGLCQQRGGMFVTLDTHLTAAAIHAPHENLIRVL